MTSPADDLTLVQAAFARVFDGRDVTPSSDFFELGGDSLAAQALFADLEAATGLELHPSLIFSASTPEALGAQIARQRGAARQP